MGWMWLWALAALAGPVGDLGDATAGEPVVAIRCDRASRVVGPMAAGQGLGLDAFSEIAGGDQGMFDLEQPLYMTVNVTDGGAILAVDTGVLDPDRIAARLADPDFREQLPEDADVTQHDGRLRMAVPQPGEFAPATEAVVARVDGAADEGCVLAVDVQSLLAGQRSPFPLMDRATVLLVQFTSPRTRHRITVEGPPPPDELRAVLDGEGPAGLPSPRSSVHFPVVFQAHGTLREVLVALSTLTEGTDALLYATLAERIPKRVKGAPGLALALGTPEEGGAVVIPMRRPRGPKRLLKALAKVAGAVRAEVERQPNGTLRITPPGRESVTAGARKGLLVVALRADVVYDVLADVGEPWLPDPTGPYGLRFRADPGMLPALGVVDGYVEARYADGVLRIDVTPAPRE